jgi:type IV pilus assembly protein PilC
MIAAGEVGGILDNILSRWRPTWKEAAKLKAKVKGAMTYPIINHYHCR